MEDLADDGVLTSEQHLSRYDRDSITRHITCLGTDMACQSFPSRGTIKAAFSGPSLFLSASSCSFYLEKNPTLKEPGTRSRRRQVELLQKEEISFSLHVGASLGWHDTSGCVTLESLQFDRIQVNTPSLACILKC